MPGTALFLSPMARKKPVSGKYEPNSYRVISYQAESLPTERPHKVTKHAPSTMVADFNILGPSKSNTKPVPPEYRYNRPNPRNVGFLRQNVNLLNEPVCNVGTASTAKEQHRWWPHQTLDEPLVTPAHTLDTTVRGDFQYRGAAANGNTRHSSNPNTVPALGAAPVTQLRQANGEQRVFKEGISYEHQFNCRLDPAYPVRGKRHGSFVWDAMPHKDVTRMLQKYHHGNGESPAPSPKVEPPAATEPQSPPSAVPILPPIAAL